MEEEKVNVKKYDIFIIGHISLDENIYRDQVERIYGGAVLYAAYAAATGQNKIGILTKSSEDDEKIASLFNILKEDIYHIKSGKTTSIRNEYLTEDRENRVSTVLSVADPFRTEEIPADVDANIYYLAGLIQGDFGYELIKKLSKKGKVAVDAQGLLRKSNNGYMFYEDWDKKYEYLPYINFLKTDANESRIMTGIENREKAAELFRNWGSQEVMITYNTEVLVYDGHQYYKAPFKPRNLSGRTGRGDTCFGAYISERIHREPDEALYYAAALTSLKMETPGPFKGTREDVLNYMDNYYRNYLYEYKLKLGC